MDNIVFNLEVLGIVLLSAMCLWLLTQLGDPPGAKPRKKKKEKWQTDYYAKDPKYMKRLEEEKNKPKEPKVFRGKRGGKFTRSKTKEGRPYRRYF